MAARYRIGIRLPDEERAQPCDAGVLAEEVAQERVHVVAAERQQRNLSVARPFHPAGVELRTEVHEHQAAARERSIDDVGEELRARVVDPVQILHQHDAGLLARLGFDDAADGTQEAPLHLGALYLPRPIGIRDTMSAFIASGICPLNWVSM